MSLRLKCVFNNKVHGSSTVTVSGIKTFAPITKSYEAIIRVSVNSPSPMCHFPSHVQESDPLRFASKIKAFIITEMAMRNFCLYNFDNLLVNKYSSRTDVQ